MFMNASCSTRVLLRILFPVWAISLTLIAPGHFSIQVKTSQSPGTWISVSAMNVARRSHTATLLSDGRVLVAGGLDQVNLRLPPSLAGRGEVDLLVTADGVVSNAVQVNIK